MFNLTTWVPNEFDRVSFGVVDAGEAAYALHLAFVADLDIRRLQFCAETIASKSATRKFSMKVLSAAK